MVHVAVLICQQQPKTYEYFIDHYKQCKQVRIIFDRLVFLQLVPAAVFQTDHNNEPGFCSRDGCMDECTFLL